jgi:hypothetical protein
MTPHSDHHAAEDILQTQLQHRTQFLQSRIDDVEQCKDVVKELVASHAHALEHKLKEEDLLFKRASLTPEVSERDGTWAYLRFTYSALLVCILKRNPSLYLAGSDCDHELQAAAPTVCGSRSDH